MKTEINTPTLIVILAVVALIIGALAWRSVKPPSVQTPPGYIRGGESLAAP